MTTLRCYWNLHLHHWSVQAKLPGKGWRVIGHANGILLDGVEFKVSQKGRQRCLLEKKKNVHAFAVGTLKSIIWVGEDAIADRRYLWDEQAVLTSRKLRGYGTAITYNPYRAGYFFTLEQIDRTTVKPGERIDDAGLTYFGTDIVGSKIIPVVRAR